MPEIGATLREARMRARIDVSEIEAQTKIRAKYLRALENEEWSLLPGPTFVRSFLRTYAQALGLDGKALVEEYRLRHEGPGEVHEPIVPGPRGRRQRRERSGASRAYIAAVAVVGSLIVLLIVLIAISGGEGPSRHRGATTPVATRTAQTPVKRAAPPPVRIVTLALRPLGAVYVCLVGDHGRVLVPGRELQVGEETPTYRAHRFLVVLGNNAVTMVVDGRPRSVPASSGPIRYSLTRARGRQRLSEAQAPTCK